MKPGPKPKTWQQFLAFLHTRIEQRGPDECWPYLNKPIKNGTCYATFHQKHFKAARAILGEKLGRPVRNGMDTCHTCDNPRCMNPAHLWEGTRAQNIADMDRKGRRNTPHGESRPAHKLTEQQVLTIRSKFDNRVSGLRELSREFHVTHKTISDIVYRLKWKHI